MRIKLPGKPGDPERFAVAEQYLDAVNVENWLAEQVWGDFDKILNDEFMTDVTQKIAQQAILGFIQSVEFSVNGDGSVVLAFDDFEHSFVIGDIGEILEEQLGLSDPDDDNDKYNSPLIAMLEAVLAKAKSKPST